MNLTSYHTPHKFTKFGLLACFSMVLHLTPTQCFAQDDKSEVSQALADSRLSTFIQGGYVYQPDTDIDGSSANFRAYRFFVQPGITYAPDRTKSFSLALGYGYDDYDFNGRDGFGVLHPWDAIHSLRLSAPVRFTKGRNWSFFLVPTIRFTGEKDADVNDSMTGGAFVGFAYRINERFTIGPGIGVISQIKDDASIFPVLIINWKITDTLSLETGRGLGATLGPGVSLNWKITEQWQLTLGGRYEKLRFRLDDKAQTPNGIGQDESLPVYGGITYNFNPNARISMVGGIEASGELQLEDKHGNVIEQEEYESAPFFGLSFSYRF
ncbi:MAG: TonB-dependent receptor [Deltaproteobacteria bacterium]|jgi:hypothetical protein|nr:TonB-dependent receptor [Deltaproteobacteria bacterium]